MIKRIQGTQASGRSQASAYKDLVCVVATATDQSLDLAGQTLQTLHTLEKHLIELGSDKTRIVSAQVYVANIDDKSILDEVWRNWIGENPEHWPQRACVGVNLGGNWLIEITVTAIKKM